MLMFNRQYKNSERCAYKKRTQIDLQSRTSLRHHVRQRLQLHRIPDIKEIDQRSRNFWTRRRKNLVFEPFHSGKRR
jgi:hypothetical protein